MSSLKKLMERGTLYGIVTFFALFSVFPFYWMLIAMFKRDHESHTRVSSNLDANGSSVNGMHLCVKGRYGYVFIHHPRRHTRPLVREYLLKDEPRPASRGRFVAVDWGTAIDIVARKLKQFAC